ncbi:MAG: Nucleotidyltransferase substrate binding protein, HI0074 family [uncultured bacterium]|nr:MAG: Nucleotidyltransferase substrate binding protein, HI0074 family [uncultured bacterium]
MNASVIFNTVDISPLQNALKSLKEGLSRSPSNLLERDGILQRFEYTFELTWKIIRKCLLAMGRAEVSASPRPVLREAIREHFINDFDAWLDFLEARNNLSHIYNEVEAERVYEIAKKFPESVDVMISNLIKYGRQE